METLKLDAALSEKTAAAVGSCPLFRALKPEQVPQVLKIAELVRFAAGEVMVSEGEPSDTFFVIVAGHASVRVSRGKGEAVEIGRAGEGLHRHGHGAGGPGQGDPGRGAGGGEPAARGRPP